MPAFIERRPEQAQKFPFLIKKMFQHGLHRLFLPFQRSKA